MRGEWVTTKEAAAIIECSVSQVHQIAKRKNWEVKLVPRSAPPYGSPFKTFRRTAAKKYAEEKAARKLRSYNKNAHTSEIVNLVKWTDGLKAWPTDDEILEHTSLHYKYQDIVSVLESREARDKKFQWPELSGGDEHDYESVECQEPVGVGASN